MKTFIAVSAVVLFLFSPMNAEASSKSARTLKKTFYPNGTVRYSLSSVPCTVTSVSHGVAIASWKGKLTQRSFIRKNGEDVSTAWTTGERPRPVSPGEGDYIREQCGELVRLLPKPLQEQLQNLFPKDAK